MQKKSQGDGPAWPRTAGGCRQTIRYIVKPYNRHNKLHRIPTRKRRRLNRSSSVTNVKIRLNQSFLNAVYFLFKYLNKYFALAIVRVAMSAWPKNRCNRS